MTAFAEDTPFGDPEQPEQDDNWRPLGSLIRDLKAEVEAAIAEKDADAALEAHEALIRAEHEQRVIETVRRLSK